MKLLPTLLLNVVVVAVGLFVYERWIRPKGPDEDYLSDATLERLEEQMKQVAMRRGGTGANVREIRIADAVRRLNLGLSPEAEGRLGRLCEDFQQNRIRFWADPSTRKLDAKEYEHAYRAFIERHLVQIRELVKDPKQQEMVIRRFIWDGRIIRRNVGK